MKAFELRLSRHSSRQVWRSQAAGRADNLVWTADSPSPDGAWGEGSGQLVLMLQSA